MTATFDVLCIGHASYDLVFSVPHHPAADEKLVAGQLLGSGGGPAANAAVQAARLGCRSAFIGYLGDDCHGDSHLRELREAGVHADLVVRGGWPTPLSVVLVKPDGQRALVNYRAKAEPLPATAVDVAALSALSAKVALFDGHEPLLAQAFLAACASGVPTVLDAGSVHQGTLALADKVGYLVCSEAFATGYAGSVDAALPRLAALAPAVVVTLGDAGLVWRRGGDHGRLPAPAVAAVDSTGAGDAFHGAFAAGLAEGLDWQALLRHASAAGALCCTRVGARPGLADRQQLAALLAQWHPA